jgi:hypothetical protein
MRAGESFSSPAPESVSPASIASSLLALTKLNNADLAVALLVDFWSPGKDRISDEAAILVVDAALRCPERNAQLIAAELLCRKASTLDTCDSLHWPSSIDGCWNPRFGPKTKILLVDALTVMAMAKAVNENALRSVAVRLYGIFHGETDDNVKGCVATLIAALIPALCRLGYDDFMQGNTKVMIGDLTSAAGHAERNVDDFLARMVVKRSDQLREWAEPCILSDLKPTPGALAAAMTNPTP